MIILASDTELEINSIHTFETMMSTLSDNEGNPRTDFRFKVMRKATRDEFIETHKDYPGLMETESVTRDYYYQVSID